MRTTNLTLSLALSLSILVTGACKDSPVPGGAANGAAQAGGDSDSEDAKLNAAIQCQNIVSAAVHRARTQYVRSVDPEVGPTPESKSIYVGPVDPTSCAKPLADAIAIKPAIKELDDAMAAYRTALEAAAPVVNDAHNYYDQKRHLDDGLAKGKELHPKLMSSFQAFDAADRALGELVKVRNRARKEADLATYEKDPKQRGRYLRGMLLLAAEDLIDVGLAPELEKIDVAAFTARLDALDKKVAELNKYADESGDDQLKGSANYYLKAALAIARRIREKTPYHEHEVREIARGMGQHIDGSIPNLLQEYNDLIDDANRSRFR